jgi:hypothetical protein
MKASIKVEHSRPGHRAAMDIEYDTLDSGTIWLEIRAPAGLKHGDPGYFPPKTYRMFVGEKGGLYLK